ncbi:MAG: preprotein translocase subunit SecY [Alphaproteobacteria bacterium]
MASSAQTMPGMGLGAFSKASELKKRILFVLGALIVYRLGTYLPLPGIDPQLARDIFSQQQGLTQIAGVFTGGALERMSIFALGIMPYISASIVMQLMTAVSPKFEAMKKEGEAGRQKINQYTRMLTVFLAAAQGYGLAVGFRALSTSANTPAIIVQEQFFIVSTIITIIGGTLFLMWLGEQITSRGVGNGISLLIFAGIVAELPRSIAQTLELGRTQTLDTPIILGILALAVVLILGIVYMERAQRRLIVQYPKRMTAQGMPAQGQSTHLPLKLNTAGVIPPIFASSLLLLPITIVGFSANQGPEWVQEVGRLLSHGQPLYMALYAGLILFFCFFYTAVVFNPKDTADNLKKQGGFIPGIRPGAPTADYIDYVLTRITVIGAAYITIVCLIPEFILAQYQQIPFYLGGTSLLIVVTVTIDTMTQVQSHLIAHQYEGILRKAKLRGRRS